MISLKFQHEASTLEMTFSRLSR